MITRMFMKKERAPKTYDGFATPPRGPRFLWPVRIISLTIMVSIAALVNQVEAALRPLQRLLDDLGVAIK